MASELITTWTEYAAALDRLLGITTQRIDIYDEDLVHLGLEEPGRHARLRQLIHAGNSNAPALRIAVRNAGPLRRAHPRLLTLFATHGHVATARETPSHLANLRDGMIIGDSRYALIRFERNLPRSTLLTTSPQAVHRYAQRFAEIWEASCAPVQTHPLGL